MDWNTPSILCADTASNTPPTYPMFVEHVHVDHYDKLIHVCIENMYYHISNIILVYDIDVCHLF